MVRLSTQRRRLLRAMTDEVAEEGLAATTRQTLGAGRLALVDRLSFAVTMRLAAGGLSDVVRLRRDLLVAAGRLCPWIEE